MRWERNPGAWARLPFLAIALLVALTGSARAGTDVEVFGGASFWFPELDTVYDASYTPSRVGGINELFRTPDPRSHASQSLTLHGERSWGFGLGVNVYPNRVLGFQFLMDYGRVTLGGDNPPQHFDLTWDSINFPSPEPVVRHAEFSLDSKPTSGELREWTFSFNGAARFGAGRTVSGSVSGGLTYFRFHGEGQELDAFTAWLGGHAVLFSELYEMSYTLSDSDAIGFNVGGEIEVSIGRKVALFADGRLLHASKTETSVRLEDFLSSNATVPISLVESSLALPPVRIDPGYFRLLFGAKVKL